MNPSLTGTSLSDTECISRILNGETELYREIIRKYNSYLYKIGRSYGFDHSDVEDLMQETYINAYTNLAKFENRSSFKTWIVRIMLNQCYHRKHKITTSREIPDENINEENSPLLHSSRQSDPGKTTQNHELRKVLEQAINNIPEDYRIVFALRELNGMSVNETATALSISESNVKVRLNRARHLLQNKISQTYSHDEVFEFNLIYCDGMVNRVMNRIYGK
ncbi:MAG: sigma-70 family RNA polymerase sigma factor [Chitinophagaceae bacterium]|nr:sigma-70 family RNA polymerase sigma factor [Chitinophagaceae bacterium]